MTAFAYYRLPYLHHATYVAQHGGEPEVLSSVRELNGKEGFVVAPFAPSSKYPVLLIHPDEKKLIAIPTEAAGASENASRRNVSYVGTQQNLRRDVVNTTSGRNFVPDSEQQNYAHDFECFHEQLKLGTFRKIVLARVVVDENLVEKLKTNTPKKLVFQRLFEKACALYPRMFVALVYTKLSGMWLMATPEVLLKGDGLEMTTMSLAGTQKAEPSQTVADYPVEGVEWSDKNREEQQYVTDYIEQCVKTFSDDFSLKGPYTTMAANLYHLRTDIAFRLLDTNHLGDVLESLYPTPAVCGIPKDETRQFILQHEHQPRKYYSGFVGPLSLSGKTHLFVSLRCMNIQEDGTCALYAGGGLLKESEMENEWKETEAKLQTIKNVLF